MEGARLEAWGSAHSGRSLLFLLIPQSSWPQRKGRPSLTSLTTPRSHVDPRRWQSLGGLQRMLPAASIFSFLLHRNMNLLSEKTFNYHFGNQLRVKKPQGRRRTYLCYKLKLPNETLVKGYFINKVPSGPPGSRAGGADPVLCAGQTPTRRWV